MAVRLGGDAADTLVGTGAADFMTGLLGNDILRLGDGIDAADGWFGNDTFFVGTGHAAIAGGQGTDTVNVAAGQWVISTYGAFGYVGLINLATGQIVVMDDVEQVNFGSVATRFIKGTNAADIINGLAGADYIHGGAGNDRITSNGGNDWVSGGRGADTISTGDGDDVVDESYGELARLPNTLERNIIDTGTGNDIVQLATGVSRTLQYQIQGGSGLDVVYAGDAGLRFAVSGTTTTMGTSYGGTINYATLVGVEQVVAADGTVYTLRGNAWSTTRNVITSGTGTVLAEDIRGGTGNDTLRGGGGVDRFYGGAGVDTVVLDGRAEFYAGSNYFGPDNLLRLYSQQGSDRTPFVSLARDIERITFTNGAGTADDKTYNLKFITTSAAGATSTGHDFIVMAPGAGLAASTVLLLNSGDDILTGQGALTRIDAGAGNDYVFWANASANTTYLGGAGDDTIFVARHQQQTTSTITIDGGIGHDNLSYAGFGASRINGGDGDDRLLGNLNSIMTGGNGNDAFELELVRQTGVAVGSINGGAGDDMVSLGVFSSDAIITKTSTGFTVFDKVFGLTYTVTSVEGLKFLDMAIDTRLAFTTYRGDSLVNERTGGAGIDLMHGGAGNDRLDGGTGNDSVSGDAGADTLRGGVGNDTLIGGTGNDVLTGGSGFDIFLFRQGDGHDRIVDFQEGAGLGDVIGLTLDPGATFEDVMTAATQVGNNVVISFGPNDSITLTDVLRSQLVADDFYFF